MVNNVSNDPVRSTATVLVATACVSHIDPKTIFGRRGTTTSCPCATISRPIITAHGTRWCGKCVSLTLEPKTTNRSLASLFPGQANHDRSTESCGGFAEPPGSAK